MADFVKLRNSDDSKEFNLKVNNVSNTTSRNISIDVANEVDLGGFNIDIDASTIQLDGVITDDTDPTDYPNSSTYPDDKHGMAVELEDLPKDPDWNYLSLTGLSKIEWNRGGYNWLRNGVVQDVDVDFNSDRGYYEFNIIFAELDVTF